MTSVIVDTREQRPWEFEESEVATLPVADYAPKGFEHLVLVERKGSVAELAGSLTDKGRFERELAKLNEHPFGFVVLEFTLNDLINYPTSAKLPPFVKSRIRVRGPYLLKRLAELQIRYPRIHWVFAGTKGKEYAMAVMKAVVEAAQSVAS